MMVVEEMVLWVIFAWKEVITADICGSSARRSSSLGHGNEISAYISMQGYDGGLQFAV